MRNNKILNLNDNTTDKMKLNLICNNTIQNACLNFGKIEKLVFVLR